MKDDTMLLRQINPNFVQHGRVTSQAFQPTPKDGHRLSVYDGDQIAPSHAHQHFTKNFDARSAGVMGVRVRECGLLELPVEPDPEPFPEHAVIDFSEFSRRQKETKAKQLRGYAEERGWLYRESEGA